MWEVVLVESVGLFFSVFVVVFVFDMGWGLMHVFILIGKLEHQLGLDYNYGIIFYSKWFLLVKAIFNRNPK
jgi:hypothetical protein